MKIIKVLKIKSNYEYIIDNNYNNKIKKKINMYFTRIKRVILSEFHFGIRALLNYSFKNANK